MLGTLSESWWVPMVILWSICASKPDSKMTHFWYYGSQKPESNFNHFLGRLNMSISTMLGLQWALKVGSKLNRKLASPNWWICCYLLHFGTILTLIIRCKIYEKPDRNVSCLLFVTNLLLDWFWTSILGLLVTLFSWFLCSKNACQNKSVLMSATTRYLTSAGKLFEAT